MTTVNVSVYGKIFCGKKPVKGVKVKIQPVLGRNSSIKGVKARCETTNSKGLWGTVFQFDDSNFNIDARYRITVACGDGKQKLAFYKGAGLKTMPVENLTSLIKKLYDISKENPLTERLKLVVNTTLNFKITGKTIQCCPPPKEQKKKAKDSLSDGDLREQIALEIAGRATDAGALSLTLNDVEVVAPFARDDGALATLGELADSLAAVGVRTLQPIGVAPDAARLVILPDGRAGEPAGARVDLDAGVGLKATEFVAECYDADEFLLGGSAASTLVASGADGVVLSLRERTTGRRHSVPVAAAPLDGLADRILAAAPIDAVTTEAAAGGLIVTAAADGPDTLLVEGAAAHGAAVQIMSVGADELDAAEATVADRFVIAIDGIGEATASALADAGVLTLTDLKAASPETLSGVGLTPEKARAFQSMADILLANPTLTPEDVEVAVTGLGVGEARELSSRLGGLGRSEIVAAAVGVRTKADWTPERLLALTGASAGQSAAKSP